MLNFLKNLFVKEEEEVILPEVELPKPPPPKYVEIPEEEIQPLMELYKRMNNTQLMLGQLLLENEKKKLKVLKDFDTVRDEIQEEIDKLRLANGIPEDDDNYSLNLPSKGQTFACFIRETQDDLKDIQDKGLPKKEDVLEDVVDTKKPK